MTSITYNIGAPAVTDGLYVFEEDPVCNYPETVTVTNLPAWAVHNDGAADFTIPSTSDLSLIGEYIVTLKSEICTPDDFTGTTCTPLIAEYEFPIYMEPCIVTSYFDSETVGIIEYFIGASAITDGSYAFTQDQACGYPETVTVTNLPAWAVHNEANADFIVPFTDDLSRLGEYIVTINSQICVPDDYTKATCTPMEVEYDFPIRV